MGQSLDGCPIVLYNGPDMKMSELRRKARTTTMDWEVEPGTKLPVQLTYDPSQISLDSQTIPDDEAVTLGDFWKRQVKTYVKAWDITDDAGNILPVDDKTIGGLETAMIEAILAHIQADSRPNRKSTTSI